MADRAFGPYRLVRQIAVGGMAEIHLAKTRGIAGFEKYVALKMIHPNFAEDESFIHMLIDEAKITVQLQHANIAHTFDLGRVGDIYYITMEFVDGADLYKLLRRGSEQDLEFPVDAAVYIAKEIATGLDYAHEADFLRLDILLERGGIYADMDTLFVQPFDPEWRAITCAMGEEQSIPDTRGIDRPSLCNAVILAQSDATFLRRWRSRMGDAFDGSWNNHSCAEASRLWLAIPDEITALPRERFYYFPWTRTGLSRLFESDETAELQRRGVYSIHLWSHLWWSETRTDFSAFHAGLITPERIRRGQSTFCLLAQRFLPADAA